MTEGGAKCFDLEVELGGEQVNWIVELWRRSSDMNISSSNSLSDWMTWSLNRATATTFAFPLMCRGLRLIFLSIIVSRRSAATFWWLVECDPRQSITQIVTWLSAQTTKVWFWRYSKSTALTIVKSSSIFTCNFASARSHPP